MAEAQIVYIIDDELAIRDSLQLLLTTAGLDARAYASARQFLDDAEPRDGACVVTDMRMPGMSGMELLEEMRNRRLDMPVLVLTAHADVPLAIEAMKKGAVDLHEKPFDDDALLSSIRQALTWKDIEREKAGRSQNFLKRRSTLTRREDEVLSGLLNGKPNKKIADELGISARTVEVHRANIMTKMEARSLAELVRMSLGVIDGTWN